MRLPFSLTAAAGLLVLGCGYRLVESSRALGPGTERIEINPLENHSDEPALDRMLSDAFVEEFERRGAIRPVYAGAATGSELRLEGVIREFDIQPAAFSSVSLVLEFGIQMVVELDVRRADTGTPLWEQHRITLRERFLASADPGVTESNKHDALLRMASELAERVHDALLQTF